MARVVTYNVRHCAPAGGEADVTALAAQCRSFDADLIALQEVDRWRRRSAWRRQARLLAGATGMHLVEAPVGQWGWSGCGNALLSRAVPRAVQYLGLPTAGTVPRTAVLASVELDGTPVSVAVAHLHVRAAVARIQLEAVLAALASRPGPRLVAGDLNLGPGVVSEVLGRWGYTAADSGPTFPAEAPTSRIDWVAVQGLRLGDASAPAVTLSDHRPLVVTVDPAESLTARRP